MSLSIHAKCRKVSAPNAFHYKSVRVPSSYLNWADELGNIVFDEATALNPSLRIRCFRNS